MFCRVPLGIDLMPRYLDPPLERHVDRCGAQARKVVQLRGPSPSRISNAATRRILLAITTVITACVAFECVSSQSVANGINDDARRSRQDVRRPRPDAQTGFPGIKQRTRTAGSIVDGRSPRAAEAAH